MLDDVDRFVWSRNEVEVLSAERTWLDYLATESPAGKARISSRSVGRAAVGVVAEVLFAGGDLAGGDAFEGGERAALVGHDPDVDHRRLGEASRAGRCTRRPSR